ncbi:MAG: hypothetical protein H6557_27095 [Lewinellaceae bacterium]|nr:hypothetical protein [Phaeodactylibacter sp.]MCB9040309.1 hypothetical protein [Lewinellaceae bacterium]
MRYLILFGIALCAFSLSSNAQLDSISQTIRRGLNNPNYFAEDTYISRGAAPKEVEGSLFLDERWQDAHILTPDDEVVKVKARYRIYDDEMQILSPDKEVLGLYPAKVRAIAIGKQVFVPLEFRNLAGKNKMGFFQLLVEGEMALLLRRSLELVKSDYNPALNIGDRNDRLELQEAYYYRRGSDQPSLLRQTKSAVLKALGRRKKAISEYAKTNQLNPRKQEDLIAIFQFYNRQDK